MTARGYFDYEAKRIEPVKISCSEKGVLISRPLPLIFFGFSPIFIPWSELSDFNITDHRLSSANIENQSLGSKITKESFKGISALLKFQRIDKLSIKIPWTEEFNTYIPKSLNQNI